MDTFAARAEFANEVIDFGGRSVFWDARVDDDFSGARLRRKIAFVADANYLFAETKREKNFGGRRQERHDTERRHARTVAQ
jgi:hypothetical protein